MSPRPDSALKSRLMAVVALAVFVFAATVLHRALAGMDWQDVSGHLAALPVLHLAIALLFVGGSYAALTFYDLLALRLVGSTLPWRRVAPTAFLAFAVGHNLGFAVLTGGALRLRDYTRQGLSGTQVGGVMALCVITFALGANLLIDLALLLHPEEAAALLQVSPQTARWLGVLNFGFLLGWFWLTAARADKPFRLGGHRFTPPRARFTLRQLGVSVIDLGCSAAAFYWLLPDASMVGYVGFLGAYVLSLAAGLASNVPGGLGVFESVLLLTLPQLPKAEVISAALAFRALYFLLPFALALTLLMVREASRVTRRPA